MTERQPGRDDRKKPQNPRVKPDPARTQPVPDRGGSDADEQTLFNTDSDRRIFGEGSYAEGGSNQEGNFKEREATPEGSCGNFDDGGGYGGNELLGGKRAENDKTGPDESLEDS